MTTRVVIVDDHWAFRRAAARLLLAEGFEVVGSAADGSSALAMTADLKPDLLLLDIQLPDISGFEVARRVAESHGSTAVVLVSTRESSDYGDEVKAAPVEGFIEKSELSGERITEALERG